jgi:predicted metalloprotease
MRWQEGRRSENVEDQRRVPTGLVIGGGAGGLILIVLALLLGADPKALLQQVAQNQQNQQGAPAPGGQQGGDPADDTMKDFVSAVLAETEDVWSEQFKAMGKTYREPRLVLFNREVRSACGFANAAVGPFYCGGDEKVYIDLSFYQDLKDRYHAPGEFAQAYVIAHEIGHHVQNLLGTTAKMNALRGRGKAEDNDLSVRLELQADFLAGVWANHAEKSRKILEAGDLEAALQAANSIGDDRLQMEARGYVVPDSFTHGSSAQRVRWFRRGFETGDISQGDTFRAREL